MKLYRCWFYVKMDDPGVKLYLRPYVGFKHETAHHCLCLNVFGLFCMNILQDRGVYGK